MSSSIKKEKRKVCFGIGWDENKGVYLNIGGSSVGLDKEKDVIFSFLK